MKMTIAVLFVLLLTLLLPTTAAADPEMGDTSGGAFVEVYQIHRWDETNPSNQWTQTTDENRTYACGWSDGNSAACGDTVTGAYFVCTYSGGSIFCQYMTGGPPMTGSQRQAVANDLARGIGNRGQVPRPKYGPGTDGYGPHCVG